LKFEAKIAYIYSMSKVPNIGRRIVHLNLGGTAADELTRFQEETGLSTQETVATALGLLVGITKEIKSGARLFHRRSGDSDGVDITEAVMK
jgi:cysteine synthase